VFPIKKPPIGAAGIGTDAKFGYIVSMEIDYLKIAAAVLAANIFTVVFAYCMIEISKGERLNMTARPAFYLLAGGIAFWTALMLYV